MGFATTTFNGTLRGGNSAMWDRMRTARSDPRHADQAVITTDFVITTYR